MNATDFFEPPNYNVEGRQQMWVHGCISAHDTWCGCDHPSIHLLAALLPVGHKDRDLTVEEIIYKHTRKSCHFGGTEEKNTGALEDTNTEQETGTEKEDPAFSDIAIDELLAAAAEDVRPR